MIRFIHNRGPFKAEQFASELVVFAIIFSIIGYILLINSFVPFNMGYIK